MVLIPGPVEVPKSVLAATSLVIDHRGNKFKDIVNRLEKLMIKHFSSKRVALLTGSGTLAVEAMVYSFTKRGEKVLALSYGEFGRRLAESIKRRGATLRLYDKPMGHSFSLEEVKQIIEENKDVTTVALVHNETSTGIALRNLEEISRFIKNKGLKLIVDSVSGFAAYQLMVNEWKIDAVATGSQKALASVPGLGFVAVSRDGLNEMVNEDLPTYLDVSLHLKFQDKYETPFTPATGVFNATLRAAELLELEGVERRWKRHEACTKYVRDALSYFGFSLLGNENNFSNTVVAAIPPIKDYRAKLKEFNVEIAGGMGELRDKVVRIGLLGIVDDRAVMKLIGITARMFHSQYEKEPPLECKLPEELREEIEWS